MTTSPPYLAGRIVGLLVRPLLPLAESALSGVLDGVFGEPDALDATYTPTPEPLVDREGYVRAYDEWLESLNGARITHYHFDVDEVDLDDDLDDWVWTLERDRIREIAGDA